MREVTRTEFGKFLVDSKLEGIPFANNNISIMLYITDKIMGMAVYKQKTNYVQKTYYLA